MHKELAGRSWGGFKLSKKVKLCLFDVVLDVENLAKILRV